MGGTIEGAHSVVWRRKKSRAKPTVAMQLFVPLSVSLTLSPTEMTHLIRGQRVLHLLPEGDHYDGLWSNPEMPAAWHRTFTITHDVPPDTCAVDFVDQPSAPRFFVVWPTERWDRDAGLPSLE